MAAAHDVPMVKSRFIAGVLSLGMLPMAIAQQAATEKPLDLRVPRQAGQWTGVAERTRPEDRAMAASSPVPSHEAEGRVRGQPYGTGYEARMSPRAAMGSPGGPSGAGGGAGPPPAAAPRGGRGR